MRKFIIAAALGALTVTAVPAVARDAYRDYRHDVRKAREDCRRDLRRAHTRWERQKALRDCRHDMRKARRDYRDDVRNGR